MHLGLAWSLTLSISGLPPAPAPWHRAAGVPSPKRGPCGSLQQDYDASRRRPVLVLPCTLHPQCRGPAASDAASPGGFGTK